MIDTIVLAIDYPDFQITKPSLFTPHAKMVLSGFKQYQKSVQNVKTSSVYKPNLTLYKNIRPWGIQRTLYIKFSVPKLLYGNNLLEVSEEDFPRVIAVLSRKLYTMGVRIDRENLVNARVSKIDYGKNFVLRDYTFPFSYIEEIRRSNISKVYDTNQADYRNEGHAYTYRTNTFEVVFYDKIKDLQKANISTQKSIENTPTRQEKVIKDISHSQRENPPLEILRLELRFNNRRRIRTALSKIKPSTELTFKGLFSKSIARNLCLHHLKEIRDRYVFSSIEGNTFTEKLSNLIKANPGIKTKDLVFYLGFQTVVSEFDTRTARNIIYRHNSTSWYSFNKKAKSIRSSEEVLLIDKLIKEVKGFVPIKQALL